MSKTPEQFLAEKRILADLQSIAMHAVALQQYIDRVDDPDAEAIDEMDQALDIILSHCQEEEV